MRILISSMSLYNFQNFIRSATFGRYLVAKGYDVTILTSSPRKKWYQFETVRQHGVRIIIIPDIVSWRMRRGGLGPFNLIYRLWHVLTNRYDIYHGDGHRPAILWPILLGRKLFGKPFISEWMDIFGKGGIVDNRHILEQKTIGIYDRHMETETRRMADGVIALSSSLYQRVASLGKQDDQILLLHGGADIDEIRVRPPAECRKVLELPQDRFIFGMVGINKDDLPDLESLFEAIASLDPQIRGKMLFLTTGNGSVMNERLETHGIRDLFRHFTWVDDYGIYLCACDVMVMPMIDNERNRNRWPNKLGDFMAAGRAVITTPVGDVVHFFKENPVGYMIDGSSKSLAKQLVHCLHHREEAFVLGRNGREKSEAHLSWQVQAGKLDSFYQNFHNGIHST